MNILQLKQRVKSIWPYVLTVCVCTALFVLGLYQLEVLIVLNYKVVNNEFTYFGKEYPWWFVRDIAYTYTVVAYICSFVTSIFIRRETNEFVKILLLIQGIVVTTLALYMFNYLHLNIVKKCMVLIDKWFELPFGHEIPAKTAYILFTSFIVISCHLLLWMFYILSTLVGVMELF